MSRLVSAFVVGALFASGLVVSGMTMPHKVVAFLDFWGAWDPSLALVMGGAIAVYLPLHRWVLRRPAPILGGGFELPTQRDLDRRLLGGAALFGIGWGLSGFCPGPALVSLAGGGPHALVFVVAMLAGNVLARAADARRQAATEGAAAPAVDG